MATHTPQAKLLYDPPLAFIPPSISGLSLGLA